MRITEYEEILEIETALPKDKVSFLKQERSRLPEPNYRYVTVSSDDPNTTIHAKCQHVFVVILQVFILNAQLELRLDYSLVKIRTYIYNLNK